MNKRGDEKTWGMILVLGALFVALCYLSVGCSALSPAPAKNSVSPDTFYRRDIEVKVDGQTYAGYGVLPVKDSYEIEVKTKHDMDRFSATTCHRQIVEEKVDGTNLFKKSAKYKFTFKRMGSVEQSDPCPIELVASADSNEHSWAFFDFATPDYRLPAKLECDGWQNTFHGVSVCQTKKGLVQKIVFEKEVITSYDDNCKLPTESGKVFEYEMQRGRCVYVFCSKDDKQCHRLTTLGYDEAWLRGK